MKHNFISFARTTCEPGSLFAVPTNPYHCVPTAHLFNENLEEIIEMFNGLTAKGLHILHIYAHSWEMEWNREDGWERCERIFERLIRLKNVNFMTNGDTYKAVFCKGK